MSRIELIRTYTFEAAHRLPKVAETHKCFQMHGHSFRVDVHVTGEIDEEMGWLLDYGDLDECFAPLHARLDHHCLNEISGLENPTSENLARWIWNEMAEQVPGLDAVAVFEMPEARCVYRGQ